MAMRSPYRVQFVRAFDGLWRALGRPHVYAVPWQVPSGANYSADVDAWLDGDGDVVTKTPAQLTYYEVPAIWGADASELARALGGVVSSGELVCVAKYEHVAKISGAMLVATGSLSGSRYTVRDVESAPDGEAGVFVVASLVRREAN